MSQQSCPSADDFAEVVVVGGGPAGLRAAETAAAAGAEVLLLDAMPSVGRKFLVAGRGGLNLTHAEPLDDFAGRYEGQDFPHERWHGWLRDFPPAALRDWAAGLGIETFTASSGRVYPREMKSAPLLRRWLARLKSQKVRFRMRSRLVSLRDSPPWELRLQDGSRIHARAVVLALGGASWPRTGSDGEWPEWIAACGIATSPWQPANCGWEFPWPEAVLARAEGKPLKNLVARVGDCRIAGELLITRHGFEGGALYQLGPRLRAMAEPTLRVDFKPTFSHAQLLAKMSGVRRDFLDQARQRWRLSEAHVAILDTRGPWTDTAALAAEVKDASFRLTRPRPVAEAISSAGGIPWRELTADLMLRACPGVFAAGEMIDWEAPTGGYLMQGCFLTGHQAGQAAARWARPS
jgi:uncharacterized flavoprotein (TIGR03862 family)